MRTIPVPPQAAPEVDPDCDWFNANAQSADWKESPERVLDSVDHLLKPHGLEVVIWDSGTDSVDFQVVLREEAGTTPTDAHPTTGQETVATPRDGGVLEALRYKLREPFITAFSGDDNYYVKLKYKSLGEMQQAHTAIVRFFHNELAPHYTAEELARIRAVIPSSLLYDTNGDMVEAVASTFREFVRVAAEATELRKQVAALSALGSAGPGETRDAIKAATIREAYWIGMEVALEEAKRVVWGHSSIGEAYRVLENRLDGARRQVLSLATPSPAQESGTGDTGELKGGMLNAYAALENALRQFGAMHEHFGARPGLAFERVVNKARDLLATPATTAETRGPAEGAR